MQRVFSPLDPCDKRSTRRGKLAWLITPWMALLLLFPSAIPLWGQCALDVLSGIQGSSAEEGISSMFGIGNTEPEASVSAVGTGSTAIQLDPQPSVDFQKICPGTEGCVARLDSDQQNLTSGASQSARAINTDPPDEGVKTSSAVSAHDRLDRNLDIYYRNRREFSLDVGWHPVNIPFIYDFAVGDSYNMTPLKYTLVPIVASLRWHVTNVGWRWIFRGNMDFTFSGSITAIPRGPETHYYSFDFGIRRNFVYRNWKVVPFFEQRGGAGIINAKEPLGVQFAQGQNLTFTYNLGVGARYNIDSKYSFSAGMNYMHISNGYLSEPAFTNYGINVYGPMFGFDMRLGKARHASE
jgi:lipid A 3-O-deacylase PagL